MDSDAGGQEHEQEWRLKFLATRAVPNGFAAFSTDTKVPGKGFDGAAAAKAGQDRAHRSSRRVFLPSALLLTPLRSALVLILLCASACVSPGQNAPFTHSPPSSFARVGLTDCLGDTVVRPRSLLLACGDGNAEAVELVWEDWGAPTATARGVIRSLVCDPSCAESRETRDAPGVVVVSQPESCPDGLMSYGLLIYYEYGATAEERVQMNLFCPS